MVGIDELVEKSNRYSELFEETTEKIDEVNKIKDTYSMLAQVALVNAGFKSIDDTVIYTQNRIYVNPELNNEMVWLGGKLGTNDEFLTYLKNKEFVSEDTIASQYRIKDALFPLRKQYRSKNTSYIGSILIGLLTGVITGIGLGLAGAYEGMNSQNTTALIWSLVIGGGIVGAFGEKYILNKNNIKIKKHLEEALARHDKYIPNYQGSKAVKFLAEKYGTIGTVE